MLQCKSHCGPREEAASIRPMKSCLAIALLALLPGLAFAADEGIRAFRFTLPAGKTREECMRLEKGESRRYHFKVDTKLHFNIHYHREKEVFYPVKDDSTRRKSGTFKAPASEEYCWMWTAKVPAKVEGRIQR